MNVPGIKISVKIWENALITKRLWMINVIILMLIALHLKKENVECQLIQNALKEQMILVHSRQMMMDLVCCMGIHKNVLVWILVKREVEIKIIVSIAY